MKCAKTSQLGRVVRIDGRVYSVMTFFPSLVKVPQQGVTVPDGVTRPQDQHTTTLPQHLTTFNNLNPKQLRKCPTL